MRPKENKQVSRVPLPQLISANPVAPKSPRAAPIHEIAPLLILGAKFTDFCETFPVIGSKIP